MCLWSRLFYSTRVYAIRLTCSVGHIVEGESAIYRKDFQVRQNQNGVLWCLATLLATVAVGCGDMDSGEPASVVEEGEIDTTVSALGTNCRELCRRWASLDQYNSSLVGRPFGDPVPAAVQDAEDHLTQAGQAAVSSQESICWMGNVSVASVWNGVQPQYDIYRDLTPQEQQQRLNTCVARFGL